MNGIVAREDFKNAIMTFEEAFPGVEVVKAFKLTQSALRLEQPLVANSNTYEFPILNNQNSPNVPNGIFNTEIRLRQQDTFVPTSIGIFLALPDSATATNFRLESYPNQSVFTNALQMRALYNGEMQISVNNYKYTYGWDLQRHWASNQTQQTAAFGAGSPEDQNAFNNDGFYPMQPFVLFGGAQNVQVSIKLAGVPSAVDTFSRYVIVFRGVLGQNSTPVS